MAAMTLSTNVQVGDKLLIQEVGPRCFAFVREGSREFVPIRLGLRLRIQVPPALRASLGLPKETRASVSEFQNNCAVRVDIGRYNLALHEFGSGVAVEVLALGESYGGNGREVQREVSVRPRES